MIGKLYTYIFLTVCFGIFFKVKISNIETSLNRIEHQISVKHPGEVKLIPAILVEIQNEDNLSIEYYMDVESVICLKEVCKVIPVRIYWNNIGEYKKYSIKEGETLEKYKSDLFENKDYKKLNLILSNPNSPYKEVQLHEVLTVVTGSDSEDIDVVSGATALVLEDKDTVAGAALTCFTLWHWANNKDIASSINKITGSSASNEQLLDFINKENDTYYLMALEELTHRNLHDKIFIEALINRVKNESSLIRPTISYFESAPSEVYFYVLKKLFSVGEKSQKIASIKSLQKSEYKTSQEYFDSFAKEIPHLNSFQEVSVILDLMRIKNPNSNKIIDVTLPLLKDNFLIARRVYWFLKTQNLNEPQLSIVDSFSKKHKNKL